VNLVRAGDRGGDRISAGVRRPAARSAADPRSLRHQVGVALVYAALDDPDQAIEWLNRAVHARTPWLVWLKLDPRWGRLASDPRFDRIVAQMSLP
jgi:hypothetical protein